MNMLLQFVADLHLLYRIAYALLKGASTDHDVNNATLFSHAINQKQNVFHSEYGFCVYTCCMSISDICQTSKK